MGQYFGSNNATWVIVIILFIILFGFGGYGENDC